MTLISLKYVQSVKGRDGRWRRYFRRPGYQRVALPGLPGSVSFMPHCSAHGLRKAASRRLAEAGCSPHQIMAFTGHKGLKEVVTYTAAANQRHLAVAALDALSRDEK